MTGGGGKMRLLGLGALLSSALALTVSALGATSKPSIVSFSPTSGKAGTKVTITGKNLAGATSVKFFGVSAKHSVGTATKIVATVPPAALSGGISVTTKAGTAISKKSFRVTAAAVEPVPPVKSTGPTYAPNGSGTISVSPTTVTAGSGGNQLTFTYTAATGGMFNGDLVITIPDGWTPPVTTASPGCVAGTFYPSGGIAISGMSIYVFNLTLAAGATATVTYGAKSGSSFTGATCTANGGATAPAGAANYTFATQQKSTGETSTAGGTLTALAASPVITAG